MKTAMMIGAIATLLLMGCWDSQDSNNYEIPDDPGLDLWPDTDDGKQLDAALDAAQGDGLCILDCSQNEDCPAGQLCMEHVVTICLADLGEYESDDLESCPADSGWPCTCTAPGEECVDGSTCVKLGPVDSDLGVCMPRCQTVEDCPIGGDLNLDGNGVVCIEP